MKPKQHNLSFLQESAVDSKRLLGDCHSPEHNEWEEKKHVIANSRVVSNEEKIARLTKSETSRFALLYKNNRAETHRIQDIVLIDRELAHLGAMGLMKVSRIQVEFNPYYYDTIEPKSMSRLIYSMNCSSYMFPSKEYSIALRHLCKDFLEMATDSFAAALFAAKKAYEVGNSNG